MTGRARRGFSLFEVLLAISILLASLMVLGEMAAVGRRHARDAEQLSAAQLVCRSRLNEILAGAAPLESQAASEIAELPGWSCKVLVEPLGRYGLCSVTVTVTRVRRTARVAPGSPDPSDPSGPSDPSDPSDMSDASDTSEIPTDAGGKSFSLTRWVHAPDREPADSGGFEP